MVFPSKNCSKWLEISSLIQSSFGEFRLDLFLQETFSTFFAFFQDFFKIFKKNFFFIFSNSKIKKSTKKPLSESFRARWANSGQF